jgi:type II secretory pathway component GspD/PulD (secretin)
MRFSMGISAVALALVFGGTSARAQTDAEKTDPKAKVKAITNPTQVFYLTYVSGGSEASDIVNTLRNMLDPQDKVYLEQAQSAVFIQAPPDQLTLAKKLIDEIDRPKRTYRLTYTITEVDDGKRVGTQHYSMVLVSGQRTTMKQGSKVPVATGSYNSGAAAGSTVGAGVETQFTYLDVGLNFDATLDESVNGVRLRSKAEQSSLGADKPIAGILEPVVRQTVLEGTSILTPGKPLILGSLDIPDSTRRLDIEVVMEVVK